MAKIYITRKIPDTGVKILQEKGYEVAINPEDKVLSRKEFVYVLSGQNYDAVLCLLTDKIDNEVFEAAGKNCKIFANYAVGFDNIDLKSAKEHKIIITNTPGVLTETVAEHAFSLILAISHRIAEADKFTREGNYVGWAPMLLLGDDFSNKTLGIAGLGRIGSLVAKHGFHGFGAKIIYHDIKRNEEFEKEFNAVYKETIEDLLKESDYVSIHTPLLPETRHLINKERLQMMKPTGYLINTSRGPIIDEEALVWALKNNIIKGAALDVFENEPNIAAGLTELSNVILTPHIASATLATREKMSKMAAENIVAVMEGKEAINRVG